MASSVHQPHTTQEVADINLGLSALQNVIRVHRESLASLQSERDADEARYEALKAERDRMSEELDAIATRLSEGAGKRGNLVERLDELLQEKVRLEAQRDAAPQSNTLSLVSAAPHQEAPLPATDSQSFEADFDSGRTTTFAIQRPTRAPDDGFDIDMNAPTRVAMSPTVTTASRSPAQDVEIDMDTPPMPAAAATTTAIDHDTIDATQVAPREMPTRAAAHSAPPPAAHKAPPAAAQSAPPPASTQRRAAPPPAAAPRTATNAPPPASAQKAPPPAQASNAQSNNVSVVQSMMAQNAGDVASMRKHPPLRVAPPVTSQQMRNQPRVPLCIDVDMRSENNLYVGFSENISEGGLFIATYTPRPVGERMTVEFTLPNTKRAIRCDVEVAWHLEPRDVMAHDKDRVPGMGMHFVDLSEEDRAALTAFIAKREPMFFPS